MTVDPGTVPGPLPESGPATAARVKARLSIAADDAASDDDIAEAVAAVNVYVRDLPAADRNRGLAEWTADLQLGATMLASRLVRRVNTPDGLAAFGEQGAVYVQRNDPDVAMMLRLGAHRRPAIA